MTGAIGGMRAGLDGQIGVLPAVRRDRAEAALTQTAAIIATARSLFMTTSPNRHSLPPVPRPLSTMSARGCAGARPAAARLVVSVSQLKTAGRFVTPA